MKAVIRYKKLKFWQSNLLENIEHGLIRQGFDVEVLKNYPEKAPDMLIQWHRYTYDFMITEGIYGEDKNKYHDTTVLLIELGWFNRDKNLLLYDKNGFRFKPILDKSYEPFIKPLPKHKKDTWIILGQIPDDMSLKACENYGKWIHTVKNQLESYGNYPVYYRHHPKGDIKPDYTLDYDLSRAVGVVSWNSSSVLKAMMHSIPVCTYDFPEIDDVCQKELSPKWIIETEQGKNNKLFKDKLNWLASQQISI